MNDAELEAAVRRRADELGFARVEDDNLDDLTPWEEQRLMTLVIAALQTLQFAGLNIGTGPEDCPEQTLGYALSCAHMVIQAPRAQHGYHVTEDRDLLDMAGRLENIFGLRPITLTELDALIVAHQASGAGQ